jgi:hypothetical protein
MKLISYQILQNTANSKSNQIKLHQIGTTNTQSNSKYIKHQIKSNQIKSNQTTSNNIQSKSKYIKQTTSNKPQTTRRAPQELCSLWDYIEARAATQPPPKTTKNKRKPTDYFVVFFVLLFEILYSSCMRVQARSATRFSTVLFATRKRRTQPLVAAIQRKRKKQTNKQTKKQTNLVHIVEQFNVIITRVAIRWMQRKLETTICIVFV